MAVMNGKDDKKEKEPPRVAAARWGLLRAALQGVSPDQSSVQHASIHRFPGFSLLQRQEVDMCLPEKNGVVQEVLSNLQEENDNFESILWALHSCCCSSEKGITLDLDNTCQYEPSLDDRAKLASKGILCRTNANGLQISLPPNTDYKCVNYALGSYTIRVRERLPNRKINWKQLTSQLYNDGVDNTGNTRVWDSETTLSFILLEEPSTILSMLNISTWWHLQVNEKKPLGVLELGAGMAGLASFFLYSQQPHSTKIVLTDGHEDAVQNNLVNIQLNRGMRHSKSVTAKRLVWSTTLNNDDDTSLGTFDLVLASDCTHFVEFHACLLLTIASFLRIGGVAILLQPPRGKSLQQFVNCIGATSTDLMKVDWLQDNYSETLSRLHQEYSREENGRYDANIHYPQVLVLRKLRNVTEADRQQVLQHVEQR